MLLRRINTMALNYILYHLTVRLFLRVLYTKFLIVPI